MPGPASRRRAGLYVALATALANALAYSLNVVLSRELGPTGFGEVAPLLAVVLVGSVPGQALQAGAARRPAAAPPDVSRRVLAPAAAVGVAVAAVTLAAAPVLHVLVDVSSWWSLVWTALSLVPVTAAFASFGVLQGAERFLRLSAALVAVQLLRLLGGVVGVLASTTVAGAMAGAAAGLLAAAAVCALLVTARAGAWRARGGVEGLLRDTGAVLAITVLQNADVLLARAVLSDRSAGQYAAGALVAKVAFFAPSFVAVVLFPRLARPDERPRALRLAATALGAWAVVAVAGAAVAAPLVPVVLGDAYRPVASSAWLFAAAGSALAAVFLLVQAGLAVRDHRLATLVWAGVVAEVVLVAAVARSVQQLVVVVAVTAAALVLAGISLERRRAQVA